MTPAHPHDGTAVVTAMARLHADDIEALAARVAEVVLGQMDVPVRYLDAAGLVQALGVRRDWVYARASELGAIRLGDGAKARLRFDLRVVHERLAVDARARPRPAGPSPERRVRARTLPPGVKPVRARPSR